MADGKTDNAAAVSSLRFFVMQYYFFLFWAGGPNPGGGEIFRTRAERLWGPHSLLHNGSFPGVKRPGARR